MRRNTIQDFWARVVRCEDGCLEWPADQRDGKGYGMFSITWNGKRYRRTHVFSYDYYVGPVPEGLVLDHVKCDRTWCANWEHVAPRTNRENVLRGTGPTAENARKERCKRDHEPNWQRDSKGRRFCPECRATRNMERVR